MYPSTCVWTVFFLCGALRILFACVYWSRRRSSGSCCEPTSASSCVLRASSCPCIRFRSASATCSSLATFSSACTSPFGHASRARSNASTASSTRPCASHVAPCRKCRSACFVRATSTSTYLSLVFCIHVARVWFLSDITARRSDCQRCTYPSAATIAASASSYLTFQGSMRTTARRTCGMHVHVARPR